MCTQLQQPHLHIHCLRHLSILINNVDILAIVSMHVEFHSSRIFLCRMLCQESLQIPFLSTNCSFGPDDVQRSNVSDDDDSIKTSVLIT